MLLITFLFYLQTLKQLKIDITLVVVVWGFNVRLTFTYWGIADLVVRLSSFNE
jgi:hypothetical protein